MNIDDEQRRIQPMLLGILVENAFKHGVVNDPNTPIFISVKVKSGVLILMVNNKVLKVPDNIQNGVGITNLKDLLKLYYQAKHHLAINCIDESFTARLTLEIEE
jgi:two-component system, LytTR family, sensor kinase